MVLGAYLEGRAHGLLGGLDAGDAVLRRLGGPAVDAEREGAGGEEDGLGETHCGVSLAGASVVKVERKKTKGYKRLVNQTRCKKRRMLALLTERRRLGPSGERLLVESE